MTPATALEYWRRALSEELGLILTIAPPPDGDISKEKHKLECVLYDARKGHPELQSLMLAKPEDRPEEFWIVKKATDMTDITS